MKGIIELEHVEIVVEDIRHDAVRLMFCKGTQRTDGWFDIGERLTIHYPNIRLEDLKWRATPSDRMGILGEKAKD